MLQLNMLASLGRGGFLKTNPIRLSAASRNSCMTAQQRCFSQRSRSRRLSGNQPKKIMFQSLGCPRNFVDTEVMMGITVQSGLELTQDIEDADYLVVNTCGFLESARAESRSAIEELIDSKKDKSKLLVTGCMVNLHKKEILEEFPGVDAILGSGAISKVMTTIQELDKSDKQIVESAHRRSFLEQGDTPRFLATPPHYAYLKIAEGCRKRCSFCIIPSIKGKLQSKPVDQLVEEFSALTQHGASEIILIAQDLGDYGKDMGKSKESQLEHLLRELLRSTDDPNLWLRLL
jgi:ribosomal protein S12 methylthiotransferase